MILPMCCRGILPSGVTGSLYLESHIQIGAATQSY